MDDGCGVCNGRAESTRMIASVSMWVTASLHPEGTKNKLTTLTLTPHTHAAQSRSSSLELRRTVLSHPLLKEELHL